MKKKLSLIVPCYNEEEAFPIFYKEVVSVVSKMKYDYELILVNDGSRDHTLDLMKEVALKDNHVKYLSFSRNFGKESAMYAGFCAADGDYIAVMDADMQDPPSLLPEMMKILETEDYDSVATRRETRKGEPPIRSWFARKFYKIINKISEANVVDGARDFRLMKKEMVDAIVEMSEYSRFSKGIFGWIGFKTYWYSYENIERVAGQTKWNFFKLFKYAIDGIINFSTAPLSIATWFGLLFSFLSFVSLVVIAILRIISGDAFIDNSTILCVVVFLSGLQMLFIGIMGQYLAKTFMETKHRPHFIISETNQPNIKRIR